MPKIYYTISTTTTAGAYIPTAATSAYRRAGEQALATAGLLRDPDVARGLYFGGKLPSWSPPAYIATTVKAFDICPMPLHILAARFYAALAFKDRAPGFAAQEVESIADNLLNATLLSCAGEARYMAGKTYHTLMHLSKLEARWFEQRALGPFLMQTLVHQGGRDAAGLSVQKINLPRQVVLRLLEHVFMLGWRLNVAKDNSIGGPKWAAGARIGRLFAEGKMGPAEFVDRMLSHYHNGGPLLNKVFNTAHAAYWLDCRAVAPPEWLRWFLDDKALRMYGLPQERLFLACEPMAALYSDDPAALDDAEEVGKERMRQRERGRGDPPKVQIKGKFLGTVLPAATCPLCEQVNIPLNEEQCPNCGDEEAHECSYCGHYGCASTDEPCPCPHCACNEGTWLCASCDNAFVPDDICPACRHCSDCVHTPHDCGCDACDCIDNPEEE